MTGACTQKGMESCKDQLGFALCARDTHDRSVQSKRYGELQGLVGVCFVCKRRVCRSVQSK